jgi:hypothetical protein
LREKQCQYPGCGKTFYGIHISKYCAEHRQDRYRIRKRPKPSDINRDHRIIPHTYTDVTVTVMQCDLPGCDNQFEVKLYPRQFIYPKYCPEHRNEYKRIRHLQRIGREDIIEQMKSESDGVELEYGRGADIAGEVESEMIDAA